MTGLEEFGLRYLDSLTMRWTSEDPLGLTPDTNPFRYVDNGPTDATDPSGLETPAQYRQLAAVGYNKALGNSQLSAGGNAYIQNTLAERAVVNWGGPANRDWFKDVSNFSASVGDTVSFGLTRDIRQATHIDDVVDYQSDAYRYGNPQELARAAILKLGPYVERVRAIITQAEQALAVIQETVSHWSAAWATTVGNLAGSLKQSLAAAADLVRSGGQNQSAVQAATAANRQTQATLSGVLKQTGQLAQYLTYFGLGVSESLAPLGTVGVFVGDQISWKLGGGGIYPKDQPTAVCYTLGGITGLIYSVCCMFTGTGVAAGALGITVATEGAGRRRWSWPPLWRSRLIYARSNPASLSHTACTSSTCRRRTRPPVLLQQGQLYTRDDKVNTFGTTITSNLLRGEAN